MTAIKKDKVERRYKRVRIALMRSKEFIAMGPVMRLGSQKLLEHTSGKIGRAHV